MNTQGLSRERSRPYLILYVKYTLFGAMQLINEGEQVQEAQVHEQGYPKRQYDQASTPFRTKAW